MATGKKNTIETTGVVATPSVSAESPEAGVGNAGAEVVEHDEDAQLIERYKGLYPDNKVFYLTGDKQVFLSTGKRDAENHQKTLTEGELKTYHRNVV